jgi:hypothetical protein
MALLHLSNDDYPQIDLYLRRSYESVIASIAPKAADTLEFGAGRLAAAILRAADRGVDTLAPGKAAERWLLANIGGVDDALRRAVVATLALVLRPDGERLPAGILELYPSMHERLVRFLTGARAYDDGLFAGDAALCAGAYVPLGPLTIALPTPVAPRMSLARIKRAGAMTRRHWEHRGAREALAWLSAWRAAAWVELHVDTRNLAEFNAAGFLAGYHRLADLMALRPDLPGVYGASWLYQPKLAEISPNLAFVRETAEAGGGRIVRLRADPTQTAYAIARSPVRKRLYLSGDYKPVCYGMFWAREALMEWSRCAKAAEADQSSDALSVSIGSRSR